MGILLDTSQSLQDNYSYVSIAERQPEQIIVRSHCGVRPIGAAVATPYSHGATIATTRHRHMAGALYGPLATWLNGYVDFEASTKNSAELFWSNNIILDQ